VASDDFEEEIRSFVHTGNIRALSEKIVVDDAVADDFSRALDATFPEGANPPQK
jgi:hypothetical protein